KREAAPGSGGNRTEVTFTADGRPAATAAFGVFFIDADYPEVAPSSLCPLDGRGQPLAPPRVVSGPDGSQVFCGVVAVDGGGGNLVPVIARVRLVNGAGWPGVDKSEGVTLDDFTFADPVASKE